MEYPIDLSDVFEGINFLQIGDACQTRLVYGKAEYWAILSGSNFRVK